METLEKKLDYKINAHENKEVVSLLVLAVVMTVKKEWFCSQEVLNTK